MGSIYEENTSSYEIIEEWNHYIDTAAFVGNDNDNDNDKVSKRMDYVVRRQEEIERNVKYIYKRVLGG